MAASMKYIPREQDGLILANFTHGRLNVPEENDTSAQTPEFTFYKHKDQGDQRRKSQRILVAESNSMNYVGQNYGIHAPKHSSNCKYLVGVLDKKRGKMKVFDAQSFRLRPWFGESKKDEEAVNATNNEELTFLQKNDRLTEAFGSSRKQRALESRLRSAVTSEALETLANKAVKLAQSQPQSAAKDAEDDTGILPQCNKKAQILKDVYDLNDIISPVCMEMLRQVVDTNAFLEATKEQITEWRTEERYCDYILGHLEKLPTKAKYRQQRVCILVYMHYLRTMYSMNYKDISAKKVVVAEDLPDAFNLHLLDTFTQVSASVDGVRTQRSFPKKLKEKVLVHMLTLALLIDDFKTDLLSLQKGLTAQMHLFRNHARALGCKVRVTSARVPKATKRGINSDGEMQKTPGEDQTTAELLLPNTYKPRLHRRKK